MASVDRLLYSLNEATLSPAASEAFPRGCLAIAIVLVSAWVLGPLGGLSTHPKAVSIVLKIVFRSIDRSSKKKKVKA